MKMARFRKMIEDIPDDFELCLSRAMSLEEKNPGTTNGNGEDVFYEIVLCASIIGVFVDKNEEEVRFLIPHEGGVTEKYGEFHPFDTEVPFDDEWEK